MCKYISHNITQNLSKNRNACRIGVLFLHEEKGDRATTPICWTLNKFNSRCNVESDCYIQFGNNNSIESEMFLATFDPIKRTHNDVSKKPET